MVTLLLMSNFAPPYSKVSPFFVYSLERIRRLSQRARKCLDSLKLFNVMLKVNDNVESSISWQEEAPFDAIIVTAGAPDIPHIHNMTEVEED